MGLTDLPEVLVGGGVDDRVEGGVGMRHRDGPEVHGLREAVRAVTQLQQKWQSEHRRFAWLQLLFVSQGGHNNWPDWCARLNVHNMLRLCCGDVAEGPQTTLHQYVSSRTAEFSALSSEPCSSQRSQALTQRVTDTHSA